MSIRHLIVPLLFCSSVFLVTGEAVVPPLLTPRFSVEPSSQVVATDSRVRISCQTQPADLPIRWLFNDLPLTSDPSRGVTVEQGEVTITAFKHRPRSTAHAGRYQCETRNAAGVVRSRDAILERAMLGQFSDELRERTITVTSGNVALIPCLAPKAIPRATTVFENKGSTITHNTSARYQILASGSLQIGGVKSADAGVYRCVAHNVLTGQKRSSPHSVHLSVIASSDLAPPHFVLRPPKQMDVIKGHDLTLECVVEGAPVPRVMWTKYGGELPEARREQVLGNLIIRAVELYDQGTYICHADNDEGQSKVAIASVRVLEPPIIRIPPLDVASPEGSSVTLQCLTKGRPRVETEWLHNGERMESTASVSVEETMLTLNALEKSQSGVYQCFARNALGTTYASSRIDVTDRSSDLDAKAMKEGFAQHEMQDIQPDTLTLSPAILLAPVNTSVPLDSSLLLPCDSSSPGDVEVQWLRDHLPIAYATDPSFEARWLLFPNGSLLINAVQPSDTGVYTCILSVDGAFDTADAYVDVVTDWPPTENPDESEEELIEEEEEEETRRRSKGRGPAKLVPPSRPRVTKLSDTSVMVEWAVDDNDGLAITFFKVQYKEITDDKRRGRWHTIDEDIPENRLRHEVSGLRPGGTYRFRVLAVYSNNDNKQGPNSAKFTLETVALPQQESPARAPRIVRAVALSSSAISLEWMYKPDVAPIEGFVILYRPYSSHASFQEVTLLGHDMRQHIISELLPDTDYLFKIHCFNSAGKGVDSQQVVRKTLAFGDTLVDELPLAFTTWRPTPSQAPYPTTRLSTQNSIQLLYLVLGVVLGVMMLLLVVFMLMCAWKQRQQRRLLAALDGQHKFQDAAQTIHANSLRKKQQMINRSHFLLSGLSSSLPPTSRPVNGHAQMYNSLPQEQPQSLAEEEGMEEEEELRANLQHMLRTSSPNTGSQRSLPTGENSLRRPPRRLPAEGYTPPPLYAPVHRPHHTLPCREPPALPPQRHSPDHIPRSHERLHFRAAHSEADRSPSTSSQSHSSARSKRQKLMPQPTEADQSSNDGTLESPMEDSIAEERLPCLSSTDVSPVQPLGRAQDYSDTEHEEL